MTGISRFTALPPQKDHHITYPGDVDIVTLLILASGYFYIPTSGPKLTKISSVQVKHLLIDSGVHSTDKNKGLYHSDGKFVRNTDNIFH